MNQLTTTRTVVDNMNYTELTRTTAADIITEAICNLGAEYHRSCWAYAVTSDAIDLLQELASNIKDGYTDEDAVTCYDKLKKAMLNGANSWSHYSWSGCGLCYDADIAAHYCTPSEFKKRHGGDWKPNRNEEWLDVQARALNQACRRAYRAVKGVTV